ncbi:MAG: putative actin patch assembly and actin polymerization protein [Pleopsidium flavum]|nr:MAG: putative actin patch assembly and actin polymerization protein [Pleopsidium flavum]
MPSLWLTSTQKKPYSAITVQIERLTSEQYEPDDMGGIVDLIEVVRLQNSGPTEAARAIRKKLKYGSVHRQLRALTILDGLIQNAGPRFQRAFADEPLLERLRFAATDPVSDAQVKAKCKQLFGQWAVSYKNTPGMERIAALYRELPQRKKPVQQQQSKVLRETEVEEDQNRMGHSVTVSGGGGPAKTLWTPGSGLSSTSKPVSLSSGPSLTSSSKSKFSRDKRSKGKPFNLEKEKPQLLQTIASASVASTNLMNALKLTNRENRRVSEDPEVMQRFETCKVLRRQILRYIQHVESEQWLGSLIHANEELVTALMAFEVLDKSVDDDSDSEDDEWNDDHQTTTKTPRQRDTADAFAGLSFDHGTTSAKHSRPGMSIPMLPSSGKGRLGESEERSEEEEDVEEEDENDPFADRNAVQEPKGERAGMTW